MPRKSGAAEVRPVTNERANLPGPDDMIDAWVKAATDAERRWNEYFNQSMGTDQFAQFMSRSMETYTAIQATFARGIEQYLRALNIPTQTDIARLAERVTALERRIDALETNDEAGTRAGAERPTDTGRSRGGKRRARVPSQGTG